METPWGFESPRPHHHMTAGLRSRVRFRPAITGSWLYVPLAPALVIVGSVLALTMAATLVPTSVTLAAGDRPA